MNLSVTVEMKLAHNAPHPNIIAGAVFDLLCSVGDNADATELLEVWVESFDTYETRILP